MPLLTVRDTVDLDVDTFGDPQCPGLLLIPGAGAPADFWPADFCGHLASGGLHVVRYHHRDTGLSTHFDAPYDIEELLLDLMALVHVLGHPSVHLAGHSMGGYLAQMAMCRFPEAVASATSISAGSTVSPDLSRELGMSPVADETWQALMKNQPTGHLDKDLPGWLESWRFLNGRRPFDTQAATDYTRTLYRGDPRNAQAAVNHIHAMTTVPDSLVRDLPSCQCPFLVIHGTHDPLVPLDNGEASARLVPHSRLVRLQGAGHMFFDADTWREIGRELAGQAAGCI